MPRGVHPNSLKNLKPARTHKEASERGKKGAAARAKTMQKRKQARECMEIILSGKVKGENSKKALTSIGFEGDEQQNIALLMLSLFQKGIQEGDPTTIKSILEIAGDLESHEQEKTSQININIEAATKEDVQND